jgi:hypothetical protein
MGHRFRDEVVEVGTSGDPGRGGVVDGGGVETTLVEQSEGRVSISALD